MNHDLFKVQSAQNTYAKVNDAVVEALLSAERVVFLIESNKRNGV